MNTAVAALLLSLMMPMSVAADPRVLDHDQLDRVTAGGVLVDVRSFAAGFGDRARTLTDAKTFAVVGRQYDLAVGLTLGHGYACCGEPAAVEVSSDVLGIGDIVHHGTRTLKYDDGYSAQGLSGGYVLAITFKQPFLRQLRPALGEAGGKLRGARAE